VHFVLMRLMCVVLVRVHYFLGSVFLYFLHTLHAAVMFVVIFKPMSNLVLFLSAKFCCVQQKVPGKDLKKYCLC